MKNLNTNHQKSFDSSASAQDAHLTNKGINKPSYTPPQRPTNCLTTEARKEAGQPDGSNNFIRS